MNHTDTLPTMATGAGHPSGTVTLLFTDIEGSTRMLLALGERYGETLAEHRRLLREAWTEHCGTEIDTQGDSFFVVFARAGDAVAAAVQGQRELTAHPWPGDAPLRVRMGVHTGEPALSGGDYVGMDVHRAARIAAAGHGGQVLISQTTKDLLPAELPGGVSLHDLGEHRLKDLAEAEHLFQLDIPGLERSFPALKSASSRSTNLPSLPTPLLGRERELAETRSILQKDDVRILTLTGPGGTGKTRLALELATAELGTFADGVFAVNLEPIVDASLVMPAIAQTLPLNERPAEPLSEWLAERLATRQMLIVLDNFEQVMGAAPEVAEFLRRTTGPKLIVTSREALHLSAEREYPVPPLDLPRAGSLEPEEISECASVAFFLDRARGARPDFQLTRENAAAVGEICARLDGLPLALELAAPWLRVLQPRELLDRLGERLDLLADGLRDLPERQRTLRGAIDWSYRLLNDAEQALLARLGVFAGGWTLAAAEAVCGTGTGEASVLVGLGSLIDKNLVRRGPETQDEARFEMLESIRRFALERLEAGSDRESIAERHAQFYREFVERAEPELFGPRQSAWMGRLTIELDNLRAAMAWADDAPAGAELGLSLTGALVLFWFFLGRYREGLGYAERMLEIGAEAPQPARAKGLLAAGLLATLLGDHARAKVWLEEGLALGGALPDQELVARCLDWLGLLKFFGGDVDGARAMLEESVAQAREADDLWCLADALGTLGSILPLQGAFSAAEAASTEALAIAHRAGDEQGTRMALFGLALSGVRNGDLAQARSTAEEGLAICRSIGDPWFISYFLWLLALAAVQTGELGDARRFAHEALDVARQVEAPLLIVCALDGLSATARAEGDPSAAVESLEEARRAAEGGGVPTSYVSSIMTALGELAAERGDADAAKALLEEAAAMARDVGDPWAVANALVGLAELSSATDPGATTDLLEEALRLRSEMGAKLGVAESLEVFAGLAAGAGELTRAAVLMAAADELRDTSGAALPARLRPRHEETGRIARDGLGDDAFTAATDEGRAQSRQDAVGLALAGR